MAAEIPPAASTHRSPRSASKRSSVPRISGPDDVALVAAARAGDDAALEALLRLHHDRVYRLCRRMTGNDADALDATQEALLALVRGLPRFDGRSSFVTWSYRVATNTCLDELRRRRRRPVPVDDLTLPAPGPHDFADGVADRISVDDALATVPPEFRAAVVLRDVCALDYAEIAAVLGVPPGTVRSRIARGRAAVAAHLAGNRDTPDDRQIPRA
jgi:RNA polymerase sigma-70 factor (ECF subfamily)